MFENMFGFLTAWYNLPYTVLLILGVMLAGLQLFGLSHDGDTDLDHDIDVDQDLDLDNDVDVDQDVDADQDIDSDVDHGGTSGLSWLAFIGFGKAPLIVVLLILFFSMGLFGWFVNGVLLGIFGVFSGLLILLSGLLSVVTGIFITSRVTLMIGRALPPVSTTATKALAMVGMNGVVTSPFVDAKYGMIHLRDTGGTLVSLFAVTEDETPISRGAEVILVAYDAVQKRYIVTRR